jgi:hypothetical protein
MKPIQNSLKVYLLLFAVACKKSRIARIIFSVAFTLLLGAQSYNGYAQQWVSFGNSSVPKQPEIKLVSSNANQVVFTCEVFGFYYTDVTVGDIDYRRISMPGAANRGLVGYPDLPIVNQPVAYSGKVQPTVKVEVTQMLKLENYQVYPAPDHKDTLTPDNYPVIIEVFSINQNAYSNNSFFPEITCENAGAMQFRDQKFINAVTNPLQWNPVTKLLKINVKCTITVNMSNLSDPPITDMGEFSNFASEIFINYPKGGSPERKKLPKDNQIEDVKFYTLNSKEDAATIDADYLSYY